MRNKHLVYIHVVLAFGADWITAGCVHSVASGGFPPVLTAGLAPETSQVRACGCSDAAGGGSWCLSKQIGGCLAIAGRGRTPSAG